MKNITFNARDTGKENLTVIELLNRFEKLVEIRTGNPIDRNIEQAYYDTKSLLSLIAKSGEVNQLDIVNELTIITRRLEHIQETLNSTPKRKWWQL